jgi:mRNA interferase MazF
MVTISAMYKKDYGAWNSVKQRIEKEERKVYIRAGEIRWATVGVNIGSEIDGKGVSFTRPVLILHVIGSHLALIVPLSTKVKDVAGYISFTWKEKTTALCVHQMRVISQKRILSRKGRVSKNRLQTIQREIKHFYNL